MVARRLIDARESCGNQTVDVSVGRTLSVAVLRLIRGEAKGN